MNKILDKEFYQSDALTLAPLILGKLLVHKLDNKKIIKYRITEVEAYIGEEDSACHARFGKTPRNAIMYNQGGFSYIYLCYGIHNILNIITGKKNHPEGLMIRSVNGYNGPGKVTKAMHIDRTLNELDLTLGERLWLEDDGFKCEYTTDKRIGIDYASEPYKSIKWRFIMKVPK